MQDIDGAHRVFRILSLGVPTVVVIAFSYAALVDQIFLIPGAILKRLHPEGFDTVVRVVYGLYCMLLWSTLHLLLLNTCYTNVDDLCHSDPLRHRYCIGSTVSALILINFAIFPQRVVELYAGMRPRTTFYRRLIEIAPGCVAWMAAAERDASAVLLLILLTALRLKPVGRSVAFLSMWWGRILKVLLCLLSLRGVRGDCNIDPKYAVGVSLAALCA